MNLANDNAQNGFHFDNIEVAFINDNQSLDNLGDGLFAAVMTSGTIHENTIDGNAGNGIRIVDMNNGVTRCEL